MKTTWLMVLFISCAIPLLGQRGDELPDELLAAGELEKLSKLSAGSMNGNTWRHLWGKRDKQGWMYGFVDGMLATKTARGEECTTVWPRAGTSPPVMIAELDSFYATKENRLIPLPQAFVAIVAQRNGELPGELWGLYVQFLRLHAKATK